MPQRWHARALSQSPITSPVNNQEPLRHARKAVVELTEVTVARVAAVPVLAGTTRPGNPASVGIPNIDERDLAATTAKGALAQTRPGMEHRATGRGG